MADRRALWSQLYDSAQDPDPMTALAAIKRIRNIAGRWEKAATKAALNAGRASGDAQDDVWRAIGDALGTRASIDHWLDYRKNIASQLDDDA